jgi:ketosteroid isomerase-like protein
VINRTMAAAFLMILAVVSIFAQQDSASEVKKLERAWLDAYEKRDENAMDTIVADDFSITFNDGSVQSKAQVIASIKRPGNSQSSMKFHTEDVRARVYGDTVILTGRVVSEWFRDGKSAGKEQSRYTDTYVKRGGQWQVVASHLSNETPRQKAN